MKICAPRRLFGGFSAIAFLALILAFPSQSARGISDGLGCCALQVIPALFPFFVVANLLIASPLANGLGALVWPFTRFGLGIKGQKGATALLVSWLGGFAVAAGTVSQLYRQGQLSRRQAQLLLVCGVGSGPAFILNTVGLLMLGSTRLGACLFAALLCANLCTGIAMRFALPRSDEQIFYSAPASGEADGQAGFVQAVQAAVASMLTVCGFVIFFRFLGAVLFELLPPSAPVQFIASALLEVTSGCAAAAQLSGGAAVAACCCALSIQSLSVLLQVRALLCSELSLAPLLAARPLHLAFSLLWLKVFLRFVPGEAAAASTLADRVITRTRIAPDAALVLFLLCCAVLWRAGSFTSAKQSGIIKRAKGG